MQQRWFFVTRATLNGWLWLRRPLDHLGAALLLASLLAGIGVGPLSGEWRISVAVATTVAFLVFVEGAFRVARDGVLRAPAKDTRRIEAALVDARTLLGMGITTQDEFTRWRLAAKDWETATRRIVAEDLSQSHRARFHAGLVSDASVSGSFNEAHNRYRLILSELVRRLEEFLAEHAT